MDFARAPPLNPGFALALPHACPDRPCRRCDTAARLGAARRLKIHAKARDVRGEADVLLAGLGMDDGFGPEPSALDAALVSAELIVVENVCSLPLNPGASTDAIACDRCRA